MFSRTLASCITYSAMHSSLTSTYQYQLPSDITLSLRDDKHVRSQLISEVRLDNRMRAGAAKPVGS